MLPAWMALLGCGEPDPLPMLVGPDDVGHPAVVTGLSLQVQHAPETLAVGDSAALIVVVHRGDELVQNAVVQFSSSHPSIVAVGPRGMLTAKAAGVAWISAESDGAAAMVEVMVP